MRRRAVWLIALLPVLLPFMAFAAGRLTPDPGSVTFQARCVRTAAAPTPITITNDGDAAATDVRVRVSPTPMASLFPLSGATSIPSLEPNAKATVSVGFVPARAQKDTAKVRIDYIAQGSPSPSPSPSPTTTHTPSPTPRSTEVSVAGAGIDRFIDASPRAVNFGGLRVGVAAQERVVTVYDDGASPLTITGIELTGRNAGDFTVRPRGSRTITEDAPLRVRVGFTPRGVGARRATLRISSNACVDPVVTVDLAGAGVVQDVVALPGRIDFEPTDAGERRRRFLTIANQGGADLRVTSVDLTGADAERFLVRGAPTLPRTLRPGDAFDLRVAFVPPEEDEPGERRAAVVVRSNDPDTPRLRVRVTGVVAEPPPVPTPTAEPEALPTSTIRTDAPAGEGGSIAAYAQELAVTAGVASFFLLLAVIRRIRGAPD